MSESNVIDIHHRGPAMAAAEADAAVIEQLEWLLAAARSGEMQGIVGAFLYRDGTACSFGVGWQGNALLGSLARRQHILTAALVEGQA